MNFMNGLTQAREVLGMFANNAQSDSPAPEYSKTVVLVKYGARLSILFMVLFIFIIWPADNYTPEGFDTWSTRMTELPEEVWYVLLGVILSWGTTEALAARSIKSASPNVTPENDFFGNTFVNEPFDGRFSNLIEEEDDYFDNSAEPNAEIEMWRNDAPEQN